MKRIGPYLLATACLALVVSSLLLRREGAIFISPDEAANHFFATSFAHTGQLGVFDPLNVTFGNVLHPRSVISLNGFLVPAGFLGIPLIFGWLAKIFGTWSIPFWTPLLAVLAVYAWDATARRWFGATIGRISAILLAVHPVWILYTARSLMPNVPFVAFLIFTAWFLTRRPARFFAGWIGNSAPRYAWLLAKIRAYGDAALAGLSLGAALMIRPSELIWIAPCVVIVLWWHRREVAPRVSLAFGIVVALSLLPLLPIQNQLYGSPWKIGYTAGVQSAPTGVEIPTTQPTLRARVESFLAPVLPFGIHPRLIWKEAIAYGPSLMWWLFVLAAIGLVAIWRTTPKEDHHHLRGYLLLAAGIAAYQLVLYGSWAFHDNPDPRLVTLGNSYVRYWLPAFVLLLPLCAAGLEWIGHKAHTDRLRTATYVSMLLVCAAFSAQLVLFEPYDGLLADEVVLQKSELIRDAVLARTEPDSVIVVDSADKILWPSRHVLQPLRNDTTYALIPRIAASNPVYYYGLTLPTEDLNYVNHVKLAGTPFMFYPVQSFGGETLYHVFNQTTGQSPY